MDASHSLTRHTASGSRKMEIQFVHGLMPSNPIHPQHLPHRRDPLLHELPARALDTNSHEQCVGANHARYPATAPRGRQIPRRPKCSNAGGGPPASHRRHALGQARLPGHGTAVRASPPHRFKSRAKHGGILNETQSIVAAQRPRENWEGGR